MAKLKTLPELADVASDAQNAAPLLTININRDAAARFGVQPQLIDDTLNDAFGQRQVTQYFTNNSYYLILEVLPELQGDVGTLNQIYVRAPGSGRSSCRCRPWSTPTPSISGRSWSPIPGNSRR